MSREAINVSIEGEFINMINKHIEDGYYDSANEVVRDALRRLDESLSYRGFDDEGSYPLDECNVILELREEWKKLPKEEQDRIRAEVDADCGIVC